MIFFLFFSFLFKVENSLFVCLFVGGSLVVVVVVAVCIACVRGKKALLVETELVSCIALTVVGSSSWIPALYLWAMREDEGPISF